VPRPAGIRFLDVDVEGTLSTFAQLAVGLAGFAGIVAALQGRLRDWSGADRNRFWSILIFAMATLGFAILPLPWLSAGRSPWRTCSVLLAFFLLGQGGYSLSLLVRHPAGFSRIVAAFMSTGGFAAGLVQVHSVIGSDPGAGFAPYVIGLMWLVAGSTFCFVRLLQLVLQSGDSASVE
jgi:hypothetical protein